MFDGCYRAIGRDDIGSEGFGDIKRKFNLVIRILVIEVEQAGVQGNSRRIVLFADPLKYVQRP